MTAAARSLPATGPVWVDCDPAVGLPFADVDDALALVWLAASGVPIAGLSTCFGNAPLSRVHPVAEALAPRIGAPRVARGAARAGDQATDAVDALCGFDGTVLALAPLTNVAAALARGARWRRLIVLGGYAAPGLNLRPWRTRELNFALDERAAEAVLAAGCDLVPMEPCRAAWFGAPELTALPADLRRACRSWRWSSPLRTGRLAFHPWDLVAAAWLTDPDLVDDAPGGARLEGRPLRRGAIAVSETTSTGRVARSVRAAELRTRFAERVGAWSRRVAP